MANTRRSSKTGTGSGGGGGRGSGVIPCLELLCAGRRGRESKGTGWREGEVAILGMKREEEGGLGGERRDRLTS